MKRGTWKLGIGIVLVLVLLLGCTSALAFGTYAVGTKQELLEGNVLESASNGAAAGSTLTYVDWVSAPTEVRAATLNSKVTLSWEQVSDANFYTVYEKVNGSWKPLFETTPLISVSFTASDGAHTYGVASVYVGSSGNYYVSKYVKSVTVNVLDGSDQPTSGADIINVNLSGYTDKTLNYTVYDNTYLHIQTDSLTWFVSATGAIITPDVSDSLLYTDLGKDFYVKGTKQVLTTGAGKMIVGTYDYTSVKEDGVTRYRLGDKRAYFTLNLTYQQGNAPVSSVDYDGGKYKLNGDEATYTGPTDSSLTEIKIPDKIQANGKSVRVVTIGDKAFRNQKSLKKVTIGKYVTTIGKNAFSGCTSLKTVSGGKGVVTIKDSAFKGCSALTKITLQSKVSKIGKNAFYGCKKLKTITIKTTLLTSGNVGNKAFKGTPASATVKCPSQKLAEYTDLLRTKGISKQAKIKK